MKKSLLLALAFAAACGYVMAAEEAPATPATEDETTQTQPSAEQPATESQEDEALDMDSMLDETEEAK